MLSQTVATDESCSVGNETDRKLEKLLASALDDFFIKPNSLIGTPPLLPCFRVLEGDIANSAQSLKGIRSNTVSLAKFVRSLR